MVVFAGYSTDLAMKLDIDVLNPIIACMSIQVPLYKWAKNSADIIQDFVDVHISNDGKRIITATHKYINYDRLILILDPLDGSLLHSFFL